MAYHRPLATAGHGSMLATYADEKQMAGRMQQDSEKSKLIAQLRMQRAALIANGALPGALPNVHDNMSPTDIVAATHRMNGLETARSNMPKTATAAKPVATPGTAAADPAAAARTAGNAVASATTGVPIPTAPGATPLRPPAVATPGAARTPLEAAVDAVPMPNGMTPQVRQTGAGLVTTVPSASGPREVAVNPSFEQVMHARTGGQWAGMSPQQRASWLKANPAPSLSGEVTDTGAGAFDYRGERVLGQKTLQTGAGTARTPGGDRRTTDAIEYDPRMDTMGGAQIAAKYGTPGGKNGVRFVHPADSAAVAADAPQTGLNAMTLGGAVGGAAAAKVSSTPLSPFAAPPTGGEMFGPPAPIQPDGPPAPATGAEKLQAAKAGAANAEALRNSANAADAAVSKDAADAAAAEKIKNAPAPQTDKQIQESFDKDPITPVFFGSNTTPKTPLGSTSMDESPLTSFAQSPEDAQFKKRLTDTSESRGV